VILKLRKITRLLSSPCEIVINIFEENLNCVDYMEVKKLLFIEAKDGIGMKSLLN
jgi:hypothetical protein